MIIIDIGAGDGRKCIEWLEKFKDALVYAIEPDPRQFKKLQLAKSKLKQQARQRLKIYNAAMWNKNEERDFYMCNDTSSSSLLPFNQKNIKIWKYPPARYFFKTTKIIKIKCITLDTIIKNENINVIDFIRIDAQGCTKQILEGLAKKKLRYVKEVFLKLHLCDFDIYKGQSQKPDIDDILRMSHFIQVAIKPYSRKQEAWIRYHSDVWKRIRKAKIYNLE